MIKIAVFDDHEERLNALQLLISFQQDMECTGIYTNCVGLVASLEKNPPDVVLMDINMPGLNGIEGVKLLQKHFPLTHIIMQTVFEDDEKIFNCILAGAHGYILKKEPPEILIEGIYQVANGGVPMTASIARRVLQLFQKPHPIMANKDFDLSAREIEILTLQVKGSSHKMIAATLKISIYTVHNHIKKIYHKLHVHNVSEAVTLALQKNIVQ